MPMHASPARPARRLHDQRPAPARRSGAGAASRSSVPAPTAPPIAGPVVCAPRPTWPVPADPAGKCPASSVYIREDVHFVHEDRGTFLSSFGRTMGEGCGCILLVVIVAGVGIAGFVALAVLSAAGR